jgi:integrase
LCEGKSVSIKQCSKELRILSIKEQDCLYQYLYDNLNERNIGILICLFTGLRIGEICALRWGDISLTEQTLRVRLTMQRIQTSPGTDKKTKILIAAPKSSCSVRTIPLPNELVQILSSYEREENAYVLTGVTEKFVEPRTMQNHFRRITNACGISNVNYHALRHTFATRCVELGFDIKSLSEILGHASVNITMNRYVHPSMETKRKNMMRLSELFPVS